MPLGWKNARNGRADSLSPLALASARLEARNAQTLDWQCEVTRIAAPTGHEQARAAWMAARFRELGWRDVSVDTAGNVIARREACTEPTRKASQSASTGDATSSIAAVWCCAHLDTVFRISDAFSTPIKGSEILIAAPSKAGEIKISDPLIGPLKAGEIKISDPLIADPFIAEPEVTVTRDGSRLLGPGISDNGRGLAALLALADALHTADVHTTHPIVLACTTGEEGLGDLRGMKQLMADASPPPYAVIAIDGAGDDRIVHSALGSTRWRITFRGPGGHSWADFGVANPVHAAAAVVSALHALVLPRDPRTTVTVARIGGGESINSIPREAWFEVDLRSTAEGVLRDLERLLRDTVSRITKSENARSTISGSALSSEIAQIGQRPSGTVAESEPLVQIALRETRDIGGQARLATASTDASVPISLGIPAIAIGAGGRGGGTHTPAEWYDDTNGVAGLQRALRIIVKSAGLRS